jgi:O-antigen ligase
MAVLQHSDMPKSMFGIQGLNPWNILFTMISLAWLANRRNEGLKWDMPGFIGMLLLLYLGVILFGITRAFFDRSYIEWYPLKNLVSEELINTIKWVLPGLLLYDGCRTHKRVVTALVCILVLYFLIAVQVIHKLPKGAVFSDHMSWTAQMKLQRNVGYHRCNLSTMFAGACWGMLAALPLVRKKKYYVIVLAASGVILYAQALTGGRAGYLAWGATGLTLCLLKWRKYLLLGPVIVILLPIVFPGVVDRMLTGFGQTDVSGQSQTDLFTVTSGRSDVWPYVIDKIGESPIIGYGRLGMKRTGLVEKVFSLGYNGFTHPHNMYLQVLLDNGILGSLPVFLFWITILIYLAKLFRSDNRLYSGVGGLALALTLAWLFGGIGSQRFYPRESIVGMWAAVFLGLRVYVEEKRVQTFEINGGNVWNSHALMQHQAIIASGYA